ncbi:MAG: acetolactate synthase small subunit [Desulfosudaceae bacterium]
MNGKRHILSIFVDNQPGVLSRIAGLFSGRGYNIESLCVAETTDSHTSRLTMVTIGDDAIVEQIKKQLNKLINVIKVLDLTTTPCIQRELVLIKVRAKPEFRAEILRIVDIFRGKVVDVGPDNFSIEVTGSEDKLRAIITMLTPIGIKEIARTGTIALQRDAASN